MTRIAIIPARGGSTRVPLKNIREFCGVPMLTRTISTLKESQCFDRIVVSTDHPEISRIAVNCGAEAPFVRTDELSNNLTPTVEVIANSVEILNLDDADDICCVYATNPFLRTDALQLGASIMGSERRFNYVTTVTTFPFPIQRAMLVSDSGLMEMAEPKFMMTHSQDLSERFHECAQFWWAKGATWKERRGMQTDVIGIKLPRWMVQDIDTPEDWETAELKFQLISKNSKYSTFRVNESSIVTQHLD
jgi:N-acylneuraminate cytidylyltransferase